MPDLELNPEQKEAVNSIKGNLLILASAGTGKTTTIIERYVNLIENHQIQPEEVMMTTFTNKATKDMIRKIQLRTNQIPEYIGTMHSLFLRILRENNSKMAFKPHFTLLTEEKDKTKIIKNILEKKGIEPTKNNILYLKKRISTFKNNGILHSDLEENPDFDEKQTELEEEIEGGEFINVSSHIKKISNSVYKEYQKELIGLNMLDFEDILLFTYCLFDKYPDIKELYAKKFKSIMVDEAQDLNVVQRKILELLQEDNLCIIGDDCQNIYKWRGTSNQLIFDFDEVSKKVILKENYRSTQKIITNVNNIINSLTLKIDKKLECTRKEGEDIRIRGFYDFGEEQEFLVEEAKRLLSKGEKPEEVAILFRTNNIGKQIERALIKNKIPCHLSKSVSFLEREEIKDILCFLKLKVNPNSELDFERTLQLIEGVGKSKTEKLKKIAKEKNIPIRDSLHSINDPKLMNSLQGLKQLLQDKRSNPINSFLKFFHYPQRINKRYSSEPKKIEDKKENIQVLIELFEEYDSSIEGINHFLDDLIDIGKKEKGEGKIVLSTIHSAKGLEWKYVYLAACNETILPYYRHILTPTKKEDELRLFYVAVSRAKDFLTISYSNNVNYQEVEKSHFLDIIEGDFE